MAYEGTSPIAVSQGGTGVTHNISSSIYGNGSDGSQTFDGSTVILGLTPSSSVYTLTRDIFLGSSTINIGVSIITNAYRIFCNGTLTNNGTIQWNGPSAILNTRGSALSNSSGSITVSAVTANAGSGGTGVGANGSGLTQSLGGNGGGGGAGGSAGGTGGTVTAPPVTISLPRANPFSIILASFTGGGCGGAGGGDGTHNSGAGGIGGGLVLVCALFFAGTGTVSANGGAGGNGNASGTNCGGGGGGGGGLTIVISRSISSGAIPGQTITAAGGAFGTPTGTGSNGVAGSPGTVILLTE